MILDIGSYDFDTIGPDRLLPSGWDLDRVISTYQGARSELDAFLGDHPLWEQHPTYADMFLSDYSSDNHPIHPTVELIYIGKIDGVLPPDKNTTGEVQQQARYTSFSGGTNVDVQYTGPTSTITSWSRTAPDLASVSPIAPADATVVWFLAHTTEGAPLPATDEDALDWFVQREATTGETEEIVPGQYFRVARTKTNLLFSIEA